MNASRLTLAVTLSLLFTACTKDTGSGSAPAGTPATTGAAAYHPGRATSAVVRYAGIDYSQSVSVSEANSMIGSYLASVHYPSQDSALRSLTFDADTLREYLADTSIKTLKFFMAHRPAWAVGADYGRYSGYRPEAMTMVIVGLSEDDNYILNNRGQVYEHIFPCPQNCPNPGQSALIQ